MNDTIINNLNKLIKSTDTLYFLGDFAFGDKTQIPTLRNRIRCKNIIVIRGNHDDILARNYKDCFTDVVDYLEIKYKKKRFCLFHYPIGSWRDMDRGAYCLFGHCHNNYTLSHGRQMDVGVDSWNFKPINIDFVRERLMGFSSVDHHAN